jgi:hypothetical protein
MKDPFLLHFWEEGRGGRKEKMIKIIVNVLGVLLSGRALA